MSNCEGWSDKHMYDEAEERYHRYCSGTLKVDEVPCESGHAAAPASATASIEAVAAENAALRQLVAKLEAAMITVTARLDTVEAQLKATTLSSPTKPPTTSSSAPP